MEYGFRSRAGRFLQEQKKHRRWMMGFLCLAGGVTLGTLAFLKLYGQAMTHQVKVLECQYEVHEHAEGCYEEDEDGRKVLVCGYADYVIHVHNDDCYDRKGALVCPLEEHELHEHTDDCYGEEEILVCGKAGIEDTEEESSQPEDEKSAAAVQTETVLACGKEEHTHTDGCYPEGCGLSEHTHSGDCNREELTCSESEHEHGDGCYEDGELTCSKDEHSHGGGCYTVTTCPLEEHTHSNACSSNAPVCGMEEHTHSDGCYEERTAGTTEVPKAEAPEITKHVHTDDCYEVEEGLICGEQELHIHDDSCYDEDCFDEDGNLIEGSRVSCGLLQLEEHVHTEECFQIVELTAEEVAALNQGATLHVHDESCYDEDGKLICGHEVTHMHGLDCYDDDGKLICEFANAGEHEHDADCYDEDGNLTCGHKEAKDHEHDADCYDEDGNLTCGYKGVKDHEHGTDCYDEEGNLICGHETAVDHEHRAECYDIFGNLICGYEDAADHVHTEDCYDEEGNLICGYKLRTSYEETKVYKGGDYIVVARYNSDANLPEEAEFLAEEITPESDEEHYANREAEYKELAGDEDASMRALLKIGFYVEEDGELTEVEPESAVEIAVQFLDEDGLPEGSPVVVIHFAEGGTEKLDGSNAVDNSTTFQMESFSEIGIGFLPEEEQREWKEGVDGTMRLHLADTFEYEDDAFQITFRVEGEAILPQEEPDIAAEEAPDQKETGDESSKETAADDASVDSGETGNIDTPEDKTESSAADSGESEKETTGMPEADKGQQEETAVAEKEENAGIPKLKFTVERADKESEEYRAFQEYVGRTYREDELFRMCVLTYAMTYGDTELDLSECKVTAEVNLAEGIQKQAEESVSEVAALLLDQEGEVLQNGGESIPESMPYMARKYDQEKDAAENKDSVEDLDDVPENMDLEQKNDEEPDEKEALSADDGMNELIITVAGLDTSAGNELVVNKLESLVYEGASCTTVLTSRNALNVTLSGRANPNFTVEYYANLKVLASNGPNSLDIINTDNGGTGKGGIMPENSPTQKIKNFYIDEAGNVQYVIKQTEVYKPRTFKYSLAPSLMYFNALIENDQSYELMEIWVQQPGEKKWLKYGINMHFTNREEVAKDKTDYILIKDQTLIRLIYNIKDSNFTSGVSFYDYDISNGEIYKEASTSGGVNKRTDAKPWYMYTNQQGINSASNYTQGKGSGKLAFGNDNTATTLGEVKKGDYFINKGNIDTVYRRCSFGLVEKLDDDGTIIYASGITAPKLFNEEGTVTGKTTYTDKELVFIRTGDTYTLTSVDGTNTKELHKFGRDRLSWDKKLRMWSNEFWPMDDVANAGKDGHDPKFGSSPKNIWTFDGENTKGTPESDYPVDKPIDHNPYFGMHFELEFDLGKDYVGPLEYYFFGDDDMWVFLDGRLVCDIGGVHQSVGEYVNLWDYLDINENRNHAHTESCYDENAKLCCSEKHKLSFFYTERGASGSSCWMQFTLPSVSSMTPEQTTGQFTNSLKVGKMVENALTDEQYSFRIHFTNNTGQNLPDDYSYSKFKMTRAMDEQGNPVFDADGNPVYVQRKDKDGKPLYDKDGNPVYAELVGSDYLIHDGDTFTLGDSEYIIINYLPKGTKYTIEETTKSEKYEVNIDGKTSGTGRIDGSITQNTTVNYVNEYIQYELPRTGGPGMEVYTIAGALVIVLGAGFLYRKKLRERRA